MNGLRRSVGRAMTWWIRLFILGTVVFTLVDGPRWLELGVPFAVLALAFVRPGASRRERQDVAPPVEGRWTALNSPGTKVPSHGVKAYGQAFAIDILRSRPADEPAHIGWGLGMRPPDRFPTFGEAVRPMSSGTVVRVSRHQRDHRSRGSWPALAYMMLVEGTVRELGGARFVLGNHVVVDHGNGVHAAYAHLRRGSIRCDLGDRVRVGQHIADVGNSGNTTEPHLHVQLMDDPVLTAAAGVPFRWPEIDMVPGDVDMSYQRHSEPPAVEPGLPHNGQVFTAHPT